MSRDEGERFDLEDTVDALDDLLPGLRAAMIDLLDAVNDRADGLGPARPDLLARFREQLVRVWSRTPEQERPLAVLDALRTILTRSV
ncbi:hypothetical protein [Actinomycetospora termitidis]|uniref:Uncharacterized protein n=1 Tax=Actinomycetospora termitidis TaxID=3053470 RepID=A0ABT7MGN2_9PSEU|nr:hypothetical protein [Actinomycetospora sp. Odt1-22]MDL5159826.1 hypothetical protein [Actinomycetospora sp. Odt1-22]